MKSFKTLNINKQVSAIHSRPLSNYRPTIHGESSPTCALHCTCTTTLQHNKPLMWSETLVLLQDQPQNSRIWFWPYGLGLTGFILGLGFVMLVLVCSEWNDLADSIFL